MTTTETVYDRRIRLIRSEHQLLAALLYDSEGEGMAMWIVAVCDVIRRMHDVIEGKADA